MSTFGDNFSEPPNFTESRSPMCVPLPTPTFQKAKRGAPELTWGTRLREQAVPHYNAPMLFRMKMPPLIIQ